MVIRFIILFHDDHFLKKSCLLTFLQKLTFRKINYGIDFTASVFQLKFTRYAASNAAQIISFSHKIFTTFHFMRTGEPESLRWRSLRYHPSSTECCQTLGCLVWGLGCGGCTTPRPCWAIPPSSRPRTPRCPQDLSLCRRVPFPGPAVTAPRHFRSSGSGIEAPDRPRKTWS